MTQSVLEHVWSNQMEICESSEQSPVARMLSSLLSVPTVCFTSKLDHNGMTAYACIAGEEVMPGASLADVLFEEFEIEVSDDTVIYIESAAMNQAKEYSAETLGQTIGNILVKLAVPDHTGNPDRVASEGLMVSQQVREKQLPLQTEALVQ
jgi:hypothetical protein